jgi:hypothetical protein
MLDVEMMSLPHHMQTLKRDPTRPQYVVPWFVVWIDGVPDFRIIDPEKFRRALRERRCWLCGEKLGKFLAFVIGPMCAINRTTAEPPSHRTCAEYAAMTCPFLTRPHARRRETNLPDHVVVPPGEMLRRNPGVTVIWITRRFVLFDDGKRGTLIEIGDPVELLWFAEGRTATRREILDSIDSGLPHLRALAESEGVDALAALTRSYQRALALVPQEMTS